MTGKNSSTVIQNSLTREIINLAKKLGFLKSFVRLNSLNIVFNPFIIFLKVIPGSCQYPAYQEDFLI